VSLLLPPLLICLFTSVAIATASAGVITFAPSHLAEKDYIVVADLPCNWTGDMNKLQLYAYYGSKKEAQGGKLYQALAPYKGLTKAGTNLVIEFDQEPLVASKETDKPLHHVEIDFKTTNKKCASGFGNLLTK
jgi:hypothetical protein